VTLMISVSTNMAYGFLAGLASHHLILLFFKSVDAEDRR